MKRLCFIALLALFSCSSLFGQSSDEMDGAPEMPSGTPMGSPSDPDGDPDPMMPDTGQPNGPHTDITTLITNPIGGLGAFTKEDMASGKYNISVLNNQYILSVVEDWEYNFGQSAWEVKKIEVLKSGLPFVSPHKSYSDHYTLTFMGGGVVKKEGEKRVVDEVVAVNPHSFVINGTTHVANANQITTTTTTHRYDTEETLTEIQISWAIGTTVFQSTESRTIVKPDGKNEVSTESNEFVITSFVNNEITVSKTKRTMTYNGHDDNGTLFMERIEDFVKGKIFYKQKDSQNDIDKRCPINNDLPSYYSNFFKDYFESKVEGIDFTSAGSLLNFLFD